MSQPTAVSAEDVRTASLRMGVLLTPRECEVVALYLQTNTDVTTNDGIRKLYPCHVRAAYRCGTHCH